MCRYGDGESGNPAQLHEWDVHGTNGCVHIRNNWYDTEVVTAASVGEPVKQLDTPADLLEGGVRTGLVHDT